MTMIEQRYRLFVAALELGRGPMPADLQTCLLQAFTAGVIATAMATVDERKAFLNESLHTKVWPRDGVKH